MDDHAKAIHELCSKHYHDNIISGSIRDEIINHLIRTKQTESATEEIVNRLTVESRIEILADLMVLAELMHQKIVTSAEEVIISLMVFRKSDRILGSFIENRPTEAQKQKISAALIHELNFMRKSMDVDPSYEEAQEQIKRLTDKTIYSYQTLLELTIGARRAKMSNEIELLELFERMKAVVRMTIDSFKLYRS